MYILPYQAAERTILRPCDSIATAISNTSINSMEVWNYPDTSTLQVSTLILFHMLRMFMLQGTFAVVHFAAHLPHFAAYLPRFAAYLPQFAA